MPENKRKKVFVVGDACLDVLIPVSGLLLSNEAQLRKKLNFRINTGGTCGNTVAALAKLGVNTAFLGTVGADFGGRYIMDELRSVGVDMDCVITDERMNTINVFAFINDDGERNLWAFPAVDAAYTKLDFDKINLDEIKNARWLHSSGMNFTIDGEMRQNLPKLFKIAFEAGVTTSFDLNTRMAKPEDLDSGIEKAVRETLPYVNYLLGSAKDEFYSFCPRDDWHDSVRAFASEKRCAVSRMGKDGAFVVSSDGEFSMAPYDVPVVDTVGAGDAFNAGFVYAMASGKSLYDAVDCGNAVASFKVSGRGRHTPTEQELAEFMQTHTRS